MCVCFAKPCDGNSKLLHTVQLLSYKLMESYLISENGEPINKHIIWKAIPRVTLKYVYSRYQLTTQK